MILRSASGATQVKLEADDAGGFITADVKNFRVPNPHQSGTDIVYACVEGPEAAAYVRGTDTLIDGHATITLPDHFRAVAVEEAMTVQLTPRSATSLGLAATRVSLDGIRVEELHEGTGDYEFDWEVKAVRKGHEHYRVIQPAMKAQ